MEYMTFTNEIHNTVGFTLVAVTGRKRTLFHSKWANSSSYIFIEIIPGFLCPFMND